MEATPLQLEQNIRIALSGRDALNSNAYLFSIAESPLPSTWSSVVTVTTTSTDPTIAYFASTLLYMKVKSYWKQLTAEGRQEVLEHLLNYLFQPLEHQKIFLERLSLVVCCLALRLPEGIDRLFRVVNKYLTESTFDYHKTVGLLIVKSVPEETDSSDMSRSIRVVTESSMVNFARELLRISSSWLSIPCNPQLIIMTFDSLLNWRLLHEFKFVALPCLKFVSLIISRKDANQAVDRDNFLCHSCIRIIEVFDSIKTEFEQSTDPSTEEIMFISSYLDIVECELNYIASHVDFAYSIFQQVLFLFNSNSLRVSLSTLDVWLALGDIPTESRHPSLRSDIFCVVVSISFRKLQYISNSESISDDCSSMDEYRDINFGIIDVLRLSYDAIGVDQYSNIICKEYSNSFHWISNNLGGIGDLYSLEVALFLTSLAIEFEDSPEILCSSDSFKNLLSQLYRVMVLRIMEVIQLNLSNDNDSKVIMRVFLTSSLKLIQKVTKLAKIPTGNILLKEFYLSSIDIAGKFLNTDIYSSELSQMSMLAFGSIINNWTTEYVRDLSSEDHLLVSISITERVLLCISQGVKSKPMFFKRSTDVCNHDQLLQFYLRYLKQYENSVVVKELITKLLLELKVSVENLLNMLDVSTNPTDAINSYETASLLCSRIIQILGDLSSDLDAHTMASQIISSLLNILIFPKTKYDSFHSSNRVFQGFTILYEEMLLYNSFATTVIIDMSILLKLVLGKAKSKLSDEIICATRCISSTMALYEHPGQSIEKFAYSIDIFQNYVSIVKETAVIDDKNVFHVLDGSSETISYFYGFCLNTLSRWKNDIESTSSIWSQTDHPSYYHLSSSIHNILIISIRVCRLYQDDSLIRSILRTLDSIWQMILNNMQLFTIMTRHYPMMQIANEISSTVFYVSIVGTSITWQMSLAIDVMTSLLTFHRGFNSLNSLQQVLSETLAQHTKTSLTGTILDGSQFNQMVVGNDIFNDIAISDTVIRYFISMGCEAVDERTSTKTTESKYQRRFKSYCDDIRKVWRRELDIESLQDYFM